MKCLIVDDEPLAQNILEKYIHQMDELELVAKCNNAIQAVNKLQTEQIDLLLLDIQMPEITGLELLRNLSNPPKVIFTTAFSEYALPAFDLDVIDYLLKPISFERFARAIYKVRQAIPSRKNTTKDSDTTYIFLKADRKLHKIFLSDILFIEGLNNYLKIHTHRQMLVVREKMCDMDVILPEKQFLRVHKSFIVSLKEIEYAEDNFIVMGKHRIPIGETYRQAFYKRIKQS